MILANIIADMILISMSTAESIGDTDTYTFAKK